MKAGVKNEYGYEEDDEMAELEKEMDEDGNLDFEEIF